MPVPQDTQPLQPTTAKERVLQTLAQWLVDGTLEPGERLYDEQLSRYFQVSRDAQHPFSVKLGDVSLEVLGTSFNMRNYEHEAPHVALVDGTYKSCCKDGPVFDAEEVAW